MFESNKIFPKFLVFKFIARDTLIDFINSIRLAKISKRLFAFLKLKIIKWNINSKQGQCNI